MPGARKLQRRKITASTTIDMKKDFPNFQFLDETRPETVKRSMYISYSKPSFPVYVKNILNTSSYIAEEPRTIETA